MNRLLSSFVFALCLLSAPAFADNTPNCDALDRSTDGNIHIDTDLDFDDGELVYREDDEVVMVITEDRELFLEGERVELDERGRELVGEYYIVVDELVNDAAHLAGDAAGLGLAAVGKVFGALFDSDRSVEDIEAEIEAKAREIEAQADNMCARFRRIEGIERELAEIVPDFTPRLFAQN